MVPFRRLSQTSRRSLNHPDAEEDAHRLDWQPRDKYIMTFPVHPLPSMQGAFEESMLEATGETGYVPYKSPRKNIEARQQLLCREAEALELAWNPTYNCHWRHHPRGKYHPLLKTAAQIVFGVHLLHQHLEKSVADVADILLKHVNELDSFLQRANEDIDGSLKDMLFRRKCLKVPMEHVNEFDRLLDDRSYRAQLLDGNVTIERTINRMSQMLNDYLVDMSIFREANHELDVYLLEIGDEWTAMNEDVGRIYSAMCGNTGGWSQFLRSLVAKTERLGVVLVQVSSYCNEIEKRCGAASRRSLIASRSSSRNSSNSREAARSFRSFANNKPLPTVPNERPPFLTSPVSANLSPDMGAQQVNSSARYSPAASNSARLALDSDSEHSYKQQGAVELPSIEVQSSDIYFSSEDHGKPLHWPGTFSASQDRPAAVSRDDSDTTLRQDVYRPEKPARFSDEKEVLMANEKEVVIPRRVEMRKEEHSPPLTGKDSAYSSISGASLASPTVAHPRSASAQSSYPRAQFGLFPSSMPSTPKQSISSRHGALSPPLTAPLPPNDPLYVPPRAQTSLDNYTPPGRAGSRLLRKSSLSSLKKLFSKKKSGSVDTIVE